MKKYFIAVAALGFLAACSGKQASEQAPADPTPEQPALSVTEEKPVNMRDSLQVDPQKGAVIQKRYKGTVPAADGPGIVYDVTVYYQADAPEGVFEMDVTYLEAENGRDHTFSTAGKQKIRKGTPADAEATVYELVPNDGDLTTYFLLQGDSLIMLNDALEQAASGLSYTLKAVE